jgi:hypothetical protein
MDFQVKGWRCISASVIGSSHIAHKLPCQDAHSIVVLDDGTVIAAVADGAGSARRAQEGSHLAVRESIQYLANRLHTSHPETASDCEALLVDTINQARAALEEVATEEELREVATTLLLAVVSNRWLSTIQVGDGAVVCRYASGDMSVLSKQSDSEYINETTFLTSSDYLDQMNLVTLPCKDIVGIAMLSDGIQLLAIRHADNIAHEPFFTTMFEFAGKPGSNCIELEEFLSSERVCERTDDDKTLVLMVRHESL